MYLVKLRNYLRWLAERGVVTADAGTFIHSQDLPKLPEYLPRPFPPEVDRELQQRLKADGSPCAFGLYLMRQTGLRISELRQLERQCLRTDHLGRHFLKVPLGKLYNERLVPLEEATVQLVEELQRLAGVDSRWLIPGARGRPVGRERYQQTLRRAGEGLLPSRELTTHRLRHSFATALLNGGMSLLGVMKLLGHRDFRMTLRYTQIVDSTVNREYFEALTRLSERYGLIQQPQILQETAARFDPIHATDNVIRWITTNLRTKDTEADVLLLIRRFEGALRELKRLSGLTVDGRP